MNSIMIGKVLAHYTIVDTLGSGGMGTVYRAHDNKLERQVALKVLPPELTDDAERLERFHREAKVVAALNHPHIVTLFSVEEADSIHFLTMELVEGQTLDAGLPASGMTLESFLTLAIPIAEAVASAHDRGIVHRDLKPANVMVTEHELRVKVLDFGLAKAMEAPQKSIQSQLPTQVLTQEGVIMGTLPYMAPEQIEGRQIDPRTDIFALGTLFYEMAAGSRPFEGDSSPALMSSILRDSPSPLPEMRPDLPHRLGQITQRCLEKDPSARYQTAQDLVSDLETLRAEYLVSDRVSRSTPPDPRQQTGRSIAVLPFINRGGNPDDDYFSDGLSEELINALSKLPDIRVTARSSAFQFRGKELDAREVGQKLGVDAILEGSVRLAGKRLRITTELVECADGLQLWSERFDGEMKDLFDTQDEIVQAIIKLLEVELVDQPQESLVTRGTQNLEAYHLLLKARHHMTEFWEPGLVTALECLEEAIQLDPNYAVAYATMGECYLVRSVFGNLPGSEAFPEIRSAISRALELDPDLGGAHGVHGVYLAWHDLDWLAAERELRRAIELRPQNVWNHFYYAAILSTARRRDAILSEFEMARELDPLNPLIHAHGALCSFYAGRADQAKAEARQTLALFPDFWLIHFFQSLISWQERDRAASVAAIDRAIDLTEGGFPYLICYAAAINYTFDRPQEGDRWLAQVEEMSGSQYVPATGLALVEIARQQTSSAIEMLERARAEHDSPLAWIRALCEQLDIIADDRIRQAMERLGLP